MYTHVCIYIYIYIYAYKYSSGVSKLIGWSNNHLNKLNFIISLQTN